MHSCPSVVDIFLVAKIKTYVKDELKQIIGDSCKEISLEYGQNVTNEHAYNAH